MASIRKRGSSYLIVVSMGYDYNGKRIKPQQKTVHPPEELTPRQVEKWLNEQAVLFERECRHHAAARPAAHAGKIHRPVADGHRSRQAGQVHHSAVTGRTSNASSRRWVTTSSPSCGRNTSGISTQNCEKLSVPTRKSHSPSTPLRACTLRCAASSLMPWRVAFFRIIRRGAPTATPVASAKRRSRTRKRRRRSSPRWRARASSTKPASSSSSPRVCGGASAAALKWCDIDWEKRSIHICRNAVKVTDEEIFCQGTKDPRRQPLCVLLRRDGKSLCGSTTGMCIHHRNL